MNLDVFKSRTFRKTVLSYTAILIIPIFVFFYISIRDAIDENQNKFLEMHNADTQRAAAAIDSKLMDFMHIGDSLYHSSWVNKLAGDLDSFNEEFNILRKREINQELNNYIAFTGLSSNIAIVFPYKDLVVSQNGWHTMDTYFSKLMKISPADIENINSHINSYSYFEVIGEIETVNNNRMEENIVIFQSLEMNNSPRAVLLVFMDKQYLQSYIRKITFPNVYSFSIIDDGVEILREDSEIRDIVEAELLTFSKGSEVTPWEYICTYSNSNLTINAEQLLPIYIAITISLLAGFAAALILAIISYKPLYNLFNNIFKNTEVHEKPKREAFYEYNVIETSFTNLVDKNEEMRRRMEEYESSAKNNLLLHLLKGYFDDIKLDEKLKGMGLNYSRDNYFSVLLINMQYDREAESTDVFTRKQGAIDSIIITERVIGTYNIDYEIVDVLDDTFALIFKFFEGTVDMSFLEELSNQIKRSIKETCDIDVIMARGNVEKGIIGISKSYQMARDNIEYIIFGIDKSLASTDIADGQLYYYPTDWEIQLINNLKIGDINTVTRIIDEMKLENESRDLPKGSVVRLVSLIMETQLRVLDELNIDAKIHKEDFEKLILSGDIEKMWGYIYEVSNRICYRSQYSNTASNFELANNIIQYIDANYNSPDISLKELADIFEMPVSSLSKLLKEVTGVKYYDYLCRIRMEKAKLLLKETDKNINVIANEVGYENEHSFRRAFKRYEGITPSDYIQVDSK